MLDEEELNRCVNSALRTLEIVTSHEHCVHTSGLSLFAERVGNCFGSGGLSGMLEPRA